jgi:hypothetical protein
VFPVGIGLRDPRSQKRDLGHPSISPFDIAEGTCFVISLPTRKPRVGFAPNEQPPAEIWERVGSRGLWRSFAGGAEGAEFVFVLRCGIRSRHKRFAWLPSGR